MRRSLTIGYLIDLKDFQTWALIGVVIVATFFPLAARIVESALVSPKYSPKSRIDY